MDKGQLIRLEARRLQTIEPTGTKLIRRMGLAGKAKTEQKKLLSKMDKNFRERPKGWQDKNCKLADKLARLFGCKREGI